MTTNSETVTINNLLLLHFGHSKSHNVVIPPTPEDYQDEYILDGKQIEVVTKEVARSNEVSIYGEKFTDEQSGKFYIGGYTRLLDSDYYFKWMS